MEVYETESGYEVRETLGGLEVSENDTLACTLDGKTLTDYTDDETDQIDDYSLEADIKEAIEVEEFLADQFQYC